MTAVLIIVCVAFCIGVILAIVGQLGFAIQRDMVHRGRIHRYHVTRRPRRRITS